jgi:uncharacterized protein YqjF (DUF2071 family)
MSQTWKRLTFLHWRYEPSVLRKHIPSELAIDTFDGAAWLGLVPFEIYSAIPHFPETNVRTYVVGPDGSRAVWFFSLDADRLVAVAGARIAYSLPYFWTNMRITQQDGAIHYRSQRRWPHSRETTDITILPCGRCTPNERDHFFTARYRLYALRRGRLAYAQIEHEPWPLVNGTLLDLEQSVIQAARLPAPVGEPIIHYSANLDVKIGYLRADPLH